jgi:two-component system, NarL family, nitrate/nitrite sensor histidine kinase NarX
MNVRKERTEPATKRARPGAMTLERSHRALQLQHDASRHLNGSEGDFCSRSVPVLQQLETLLEIGPVRFNVHDPAAGKDVMVATTLTRERPPYCRDLDCFTCIDVEAGTDASVNPAPVDPTAGKHCLTLPIVAGHERLGSRDIYYRPLPGLDAGARKLLETLADQLATAVYLQRRMTERQQVSLMKERNIIARELHDSLAQSLSYLKVQVTRLARAMPASGTPEPQSQILDELRTGLNSAYRQLRELLTTFRLELDVPGLLAALRQTVAEFERRSCITIVLDYRLPAPMLSPNEEIHVLQIIREALTNATTHARARRIDVSVRYDVPRVYVSVTDDGIGLPNGRLPEQRYGLVIMHERAASLAGTIKVSNRTTGPGVEVELRFVPHGSESTDEEAS